MRLAALWLAQSHPVNSSLANSQLACSPSGDGTLSRKELLVGLREFGIKMSKQESKELLDILDSDGDGTIDWHEFAEVIKEAQEQAQRQLQEQV